MPSTRSPHPVQSKSWFAQSRLRELTNALPHGAKLPGERDLAEQFGVARMTLRKSIDALVDEGRLDRRPGAGTFVAQRPIVRTLGLTSFSEDMAARGLTPSTRTIDFRHIAANRTVARKLGIFVGDSVVTFTRLRLANDAPIAVETTWIPDGLVPGMVVGDLEGSLYDWLSTTHRLVPHRANTVIGAARASVRHAALLAVDPIEPCLRVTMIDYGAADRPFMLAICSYRSDRYQIHAELTREPSRVVSAH